MGVEVEGMEEMGVEGVVVEELEMRMEEEGDVMVDAEKKNFE